MENTLYPRFAERIVRKNLQRSPVVLLHGPRQCGKSTLVQEIGGSAGYEYFTLDDEDIREQAEADPQGLIGRCPGRVILDEVQKAPKLFDAIKAAVDRDRRAGNRAGGRFLLTGSTQVLLLPQLSDSLAGRMQQAQLHPLSVCETERRDSGFLEALFGAGFEPRRLEPLGPKLTEQVMTGGYPEARLAGAGERAYWYRAYLETQIVRDLRDMASLRKARVLLPLLTCAAARTAGLFNASRFATLLGISQPTVADYVSLLERAFILRQLPAWRQAELVMRLANTPKLHMGDTGVACALLEIDPVQFQINRTKFGPLLETFVFQELCRQAGWRDRRITFSHFRDRNGVEVDLVLELGVHQLAGIEVKAGPAVVDHDFIGLRRLREAAGGRFAAGVVLYDGTLCKRFESDLYAVPLRLLWETPLSRPAGGQIELDVE